MDANICRNVFDPGVFASREAKLAASGVPIVTDSRCVFSTAPTIRQFFFNLVFPLLPSTASVYSQL